VPSSAAGRDPAELAEIARSAGIEAAPVANVEAALDRISALTGLPAPPSPPFAAPVLAYGGATLPPDSPRSTGRGACSG
jgi:hypothetical protein